MKNSRPRANFAGRPDIMIRSVKSAFTTRPRRSLSLRDDRGEFGKPLCSPCPSRSCYETMFRRTTHHFPCQTAFRIVDYSREETNETPKKSVPFDRGWAQPHLETSDEDD